MSVEVGTPIAGSPSSPPLSRALVGTAELDIVDLAPAQRIRPQPSQFWTRLDTTVTEDLWAHPTSDLADLVAQVLAQLTDVRRNA